MKTIIVYKSQTGFTKKYAEWIAQKIWATLLDYTKADISVLLEYDTIIYWWSLHAVGIQWISLITKNFERLKQKKLIVFAVWASPIKDAVVKHVTAENFTEEQRKYIHFFYFRWWFNYKKLWIVDKIIMTIFIFVLKLKKHPKPDEKWMIDAYDHPFDATNKQYIEWLVNILK